METGPQISTSQSRAFDLVWLLVLGVLSAWWCVSAGHALSATWDEPVYLRHGLEHWHTWAAKPLMRLGTMPLAIDLQTLPLFLWEKLTGLTIDPVRDIGWALPWMRIGTLVFWWTLLLYAWRAGRALAGPWAGRLAAALIACEPVFLAHASLATSDIAVTACLLVFFYEFRAHRERRWPWRVALPALLYGIALLAKASTLVFGVIGMLVIEFERLYANGELREWRRHFWPLTRDLWAIVVGGIALTFIYVGSDWTTEPSFVQWAQTLPPGFLHDAMSWTSEHLRIFSNAGEGLVQQIKHNIRGHGAFLLGQEYRRAIWYYFPVALTIKTSLPLLLLPALLAVVRPRALWNWACLTALALLLFSLNSRVQIGVRFMLPLLACLAIGLSAAIIRMNASLGKPWRVAFITLLGFGLLSNAIAAVRVWPDAIRYTNPVWGGTRVGYRLLSDSNYDWGQGLLELHEWCAQRGIDDLDLWYFGLDPRAELPPFHRVQLHSAEWLQGRSPIEAMRGKRLAVSATLLYGAYAKGTPEGRAAVAFLLWQTPIDRTSTYFIYDFRQENR